MAGEFVLSMSWEKKSFQFDLGQRLDSAMSTNCHIAACAPQHGVGLLISRGDNRSGHMLRINSFAQLSALMFTL
jgi:hypothetical protein